MIRLRRAVRRIVTTEHGEFVVTLAGYITIRPLRSRRPEALVGMTYEQFYLRGLMARVPALKRRRRKA